MSQLLFPQIITEASFHAAWQRVRSNLGAPGLDHVSVEDFEKNLHENLALLRTMVAEGAYQPLPYLTFTHKKAGPAGNSGKDRTLRIPTVRDRIVQQAILLVIQPRFEKIFLNCSYAYRPGKSAWQALERVDRNLKRGRVWIVDADIENFFDEIDRPLLLQRVAEVISEAPILKLIELCVNGASSQLPVISGQLSMVSGQLPVISNQLPVASNQPPVSSIQDQASSKGLAQGMVLAPLLSNIYLHKMDDQMFRASWNYLRYSDNILVLCHSEEEAKAAFSRAESCAREALLKFNQEKTSLRHLRDGFTFLGYRFDERGKRPDDAAVQRLNQRVGSVLQKAAEFTDAQLREKIESIVRGWLNYFKLDETDRARLLQQLEQKFLPQSGTDSMPQRILQAGLAYQLGDRSRASQMLRAQPVLSSEDAEVNCQWGLLCELFGMNSEALDSYLAAYRLNPEHPEVAYRLGLHYLQNRQNDNAIRYLQKAVQLNPQSAPAHFALGTALQNSGLHGAARKSFQHATQLDPRLHKFVVTPANPNSVELASGQDDRFGGANQSSVSPVASLQLPATSQQQRTTDLGSPRREAPAFAAPRAEAELPSRLGGAASQEDLAVFLQLFSGREGVFSKQWVNGEGRLGYNTVYQPLAPDDVKAHLNGQQTLGYYLMRSDNTVAQMVIDIDVTRQARTEIPNSAEWKNLIWAEATRLGQLLQDLQLKVCLEDSGYKGIHLWLFFAAPIPARDMILFAKRFLALAGAPPPGLHREIFPKEERVAPQALGSMMKLPLGIHKLTNRRCWFLDHTGQPVPDQLAVLRNIEIISSNQFFAALDKIKISPNAAPAGEPPADRTEVDKIFQGCNVLRHFRDKAEKTKWLNHVERLTLAGVLGHLGPAGHQTIHEIIRHTTNYNFRITQRWLDRGKGYPLSCPRIRERHSDITPVVGCCCQFALRPNTYPSPVLHADPELVVKIKARVAESEGRGAKGEEREVASHQSSVTSGQYSAAGNRPQRNEEPAPAGQPVEAERRSRLSGTSSIQMNELFQTYLQLKKDHRETLQKVSAIEQQLQTLCDQQKTEQFVTAMGTFKRIKAGGEWRWVMEL